MNEWSKLLTEILITQETRNSLLQRFTGDKSGNLVKIRLQVADIVCGIFHAYCRITYNRNNVTTTL